MADLTPTSTFPNRPMRRTIRDFVFKDMFSDKKYLFKLYRALYPEDTTTCEDDLHSVTIARAATDGDYNDLGFTVGDKLMVLVEAQSTWSVNIVTRMLLYTAETYRQRMQKRGENLHGSARVALPAPELYVVYTGKRDCGPDMSFVRDVLGGAKSSIEVKATVLHEESPDYVGQYVTFCHTVSNNKAEGKTSATDVEEMVNELIGRDILAEYLTEHRSEVTGNMIALFDEEREWEIYCREHDAELHAEGEAKGRAEGLAEGKALGEAKGKAEAILQIVSITGTPAEELLDKMALPPEEHAAVLAMMNTLRAE